MLSISVDAEPSRTSEVKAGHIWSKADIPAIIQDMDSQDWRREIEVRSVEEAWKFLTLTLTESMREIEVRSVEEAWKFLTLTLTESIDRNVPKGKPKTKFKHPWMTREILWMVRKKRRFWRTYKSSSSAHDKEAYMKVEKETARKIRNAKRKMERDQATSTRASLLNAISVQSFFCQFFFIVV
jgi:hypothetical protein